MNAEWLRASHLLKFKDRYSRVPPWSGTDTPPKAFPNSLLRPGISDTMKHCCSLSLKACDWCHTGVSYKSSRAFSAWSQVDAFNHQEERKQNASCIFIFI